MEYRSEVIEQISFIQVAASEVEYLICPEYDFIFTEKIPLEEGDLFLRWVVNHLDYTLPVWWLMSRDHAAWKVVFELWMAEAHPPAEPDPDRELSEEEREERELALAPDRGAGGVIEG